MSDLPNGRMPDFTAEFAEIHKRQNRFEDKEIRQDAEIARLDRERANTRDWVVKALGPVMDGILKTQELVKEGNKRFTKIERVLSKVVGILKKKL